MKRFFILLCTLLALALLASCAAPPEEPVLTETEGRFLLSSDGRALLVTEDGGPIVLSVQTEGDGPWADFRNGDKIAVTHDGIDESYPAQTRAYDWKLVEAGSPDDVPEETLASLEELGWSFCRDTHDPVMEPQTAADPVSGYCGNTITEVTLDGETYSFWGNDSVRLTDIVINLAYDQPICRCLPEFTVDTEFGDGYGVNLTEHYVRHGEGQAPLTEEQAETIQDILDRNCK